MRKLDSFRSYDIELFYSLRHYDPVGRKALIELITRMLDWRTFA